MAPFPYPPDRPVVAVTLGRDLPERPSLYRIADGYTRALVKSGAVPVMVVPGLDAVAISQVLDRADGLLLPGGVDPHPRHFGQNVHPSTMIDEDLDALELVVIAEAVRIGMPILGICRGCQILNVALGGSLIQHLQPGEVVHHQRSPLSVETHELHVLEGSRLAQISAARVLRVNSLHHQAIDRTAPSLRVVGSSEDGVVEAVEAMDRGRWMLGVQYHPEELRDAAHRRLFDGFVEACAEFQKARRCEDESAFRAPDRA